MLNNVDLPVILVDTNILISSNLLSIKYAAVLIELSKQGLINLCIPEIVKSEYINRLTKEKSELIINLKNVHSKIISNEFKWLIASWQDITDDLTPNGVRVHFEKRISLFCKESKIDVLPMDAKETFQVMRDFCDRKKLFENCNNPKDHIPDAIIYSCIETLIKNKKRVFFVSKDKRFIENLSGIEYLKVFSDEKALYEDDQIQRLISIHEKSKKFKQDRINKLKNDATFKSDLYLEVEKNTARIEELLKLVTGSPLQAFADVSSLRLISDKFECILSSLVMLSESIYWVECLIDGLVDYSEINIDRNRHDNLSITHKLLNSKKSIS